MVFPSISTRSLGKPSSVPDVKTQSQAVAVSAISAPPQYLSDTYSWAYVTPEAVHRFERQWLVNLILWGNFPRLRDMALDAFGKQLTGRSLQVACVYGDLTARMAARHADWISDLFAGLEPKDGNVLMDELAKLKRSIIASLARGA